ncbi:MULTISPECIES: hypothetical protein [unclassified Crossiella]|uniref:hypothetical protein n=1 Tax=unclassified Crossiella TaxID=2620835 RepID=UPI001FFF499F|nr:MULTISPECIES: hypothetical protein [unclassified Crossiella]MCK2244982.1 hypothetical protein [Crossiella sp. S99.2]MCK2258707.1 hypothetical protein [Crossiella sp. S99.1]
MLRQRIESGDHAALDEFYRAALRLKRDRLADWEQRWRDGGMARWPRRNTPASSWPGSGPGTSAT